MSTLRVDNLTDVAGNPSNYGISGTARAWVNFNGTGTVAIRGSYNVSSISDNGVGNYTVNFTTALSNANYAVTAACSLDTTLARQSRAIHPIAYATGSFQLNAVSTASSEDQLFVNLAFFN